MVLRATEFQDKAVCSFSPCLPCQQRVANRESADRGSADRESAEAMANQKLTYLNRIIAGLGSLGAGLAVAYSGGTDSASLLASCLDVLGTDRVLALTADSPLTPRAELDEAHALAAELGARHLVAHHEVAIG